MSLTQLTPTTHTLRAGGVALPQGPQLWCDTALALALALAMCSQVQCLRSRGWWEEEEEEEGERSCVIVCICEREGELVSILW